MGENRIPRRGRPGYCQTTQARQDNRHRCAKKSHQNSFTRALTTGSFTVKPKNEQANGKPESPEHVMPDCAFHTQIEPSIPTDKSCELSHEPEFESGRGQNYIA